MATDFWRLLRGLTNGRLPSIAEVCSLRKRLSKLFIGDIRDLRSIEAASEQVIPRLGVRNKREREKESARE